MDTDPNPDPNAEPWNVGGLVPMTPEDKAYYDEIPQLVPPISFGELPYKIDNSQNKYFRSIFSQK